MEEIMIKKFIEKRDLRAEGVEISKQLEKIEKPKADPLLTDSNILKYLETIDNNIRNIHSSYENDKLNDIHTITIKILDQIENLNKSIHMLLSSIDIKPKTKTIKKNIS